MRGEAGEYRLGPLEVPEHRVAEDFVAVPGLATPLRAGLWARSREVDELVRLRHREGAQQDLVEQREDGGVGADAERERDDRDAGDERGLEEGAEGEREVSHAGARGSGLGARWPGTSVQDLGRRTPFRTSESRTPSPEPRVPRSVRLWDSPSHNRTPRARCGRKFWPQSLHGQRVSAVRLVVRGVLKH